MRVIIDTDDIRQQLKEIVTADNIDTLVEVMRILEGGKHGQTDNDRRLSGREGTLRDE